MPALPVLVTGGTGTLGRLVVPLLRDAGRPVRVLSRRHHEPADGIEFVTGDLLEDDGIERAVDGVETIVHLAGGPNAKDDDEATRNLVRAAAQAGVQHLVFVSVVGADRIPLGYFRSKLRAERVVAESGLPWTMLRATQVHDLALTVVQKLAMLPVIPVPELRLQPVDSGEVAARLVELALAEPAGPVPDLTGPTVHRMADVVREYLRAEGKHRLMIPVRMPGKAGRAYRDGENLTLEGADLGRLTWEDFLAERVGA